MFSYAFKAHDCDVVLNFAVLSVSQSGPVLTYVLTRPHPLGNQPPRPTQPGHPSEVGKMSTGVKTGKLTAGYASN